VIHVIGGAPRVGKTLVAERVARDIGASWISTDVLRTTIEVGVPDLSHIEWGDVAGVPRHAERFFPFIERFVWGVSSLKAAYVIEGVDFMPEQIVRLGKKFAVRSVFIGNSEMTAELLETHLGRQPWLAGTSTEQFQLMASHIVQHTALVQKECARLGLPFVDMAGDFSERSRQAAALLVGKAE
jgi:hypothetical protein